MKLVMASGLLDIANFFKKRKEKVNEEFGQNLAKSGV